MFDSAPSENAARPDPFKEDIDDTPNLDGNLDDLSDMFAERVSKTTVWTMSTDYTRFGIWFREQSNFAGDDAQRHSVRGGEDGAQPDGAASSPNAYGYSWLDQSSYRVDRPEQTYPGAGVATYTGKTLAILDNQAFEGDAEIKVTWAAVTTGTPDSTVLPKFSDLRNVGNGDPLRHVDSDDESWIVDEIAFLREAGESLRVDHAPDGALSIMAGGTDQQTVIARLSVTNRTGTTADNLDLGDAIIFAAKFVGESLDGPLGLTGYWNIPTFNQSGTDALPTKDDLHGSFGADLTDFETIFQP